MKTFIYKAYDDQGVKINDELEALDIESANKLLRLKNYMVISVREKRPFSQGLGGLVRQQISSDELEFLTSELSLLLNAGVTIDRGLAVIGRSSSSSAQRRLVSSLHNGIRRGESLSNAMQAEGSTFSPMYINLVLLGESSGTLPAVFTRLAEDIKFQSELRRKIVQAVSYPSVILAVCILCIVFILNYIVPQMSGLFTDIPEIPIYTLVLLSLSEWMISYQWVLLFGVFLAFGGLGLAIKTGAADRQLDAAILRIPGIRAVFVLVERIRFNTAIAMMLESGIMIDRCLEMAIGSVKNQTLRHELSVAKERVKKGEALSKALGLSPLFPDFSLSLIEVGEESGQLGTVFTEISIRSRTEFESWVDRMTSLLEPLLILVMAGIVGGGVVTMLLSIIAVNDIGF